MEKSVHIWHNPRCSKSRQALALLEEKGVEVEVFKYLDAPISKETLTSLLDKLGIKAHDLIRTKEALYKELKLSKELSETELIDAMVAHPKLIERPIVIKGDKAIIGRPPEKLIELL